MIMYIPTKDLLYLTFLFSLFRGVSSQMMNNYCVASGARYFNVFHSID